ncbi:MAG: nitrite reductase small subunit NirD [Marinosulfonomonas sp.]|nr:nitrite reductase small subunit NirD [Marinosulfonomonas sp.]
MSNWIDIAALNDIPLRGARVVKSRVGCVAVFRTAEDKVFAIDDKCPHEKGPLSEGIVHGTAVTCPLHNWVIDLETGMARGADEGRVNTYEIKVEDGRILLDGARLLARSAA